MRAIIEIREDSHVPKVQKLAPRRVYQVRKITMMPPVDETPPESPVPNVVMMTPIDETPCGLTYSSSMASPKDVSTIPHVLDGSTRGHHEPAGSSELGSSSGGLLRTTVSEGPDEVNAGEGRTIPMFLPV